ncbi:flagellar basal body L-ring protein FlgH [Nitrospina watsonii]|nr:flagellar basal body L-ring protein FlgH [Nitrospina watsonii]
MQTIFRRILVMALTLPALALGGCAGLKEKRSDPAEDILKHAIYEEKANPYQRMEGSLWPGEASENLLFADTKAKQMGDVVTIELEENFTSSNSATTATSRDSTIDLETGSVLGLPTNLGVSNFLGSTQSFNPNLSTSVGRAHDGEGTTTRAGTMTGTMAAVITEVLPNGVFKIEGRRTVMVNDEDQTMVLGGLIRRVDIGFDNTISSQNIANASITYSGKGVVSEEQNPGWFSRFLARIWPF